MMTSRESRDEYRKRKEIQEARKAGTLPPEMDKDGNLINPHIPDYMAKAPWYLNQDEGEGLKHQRFHRSNGEKGAGILDIREEEKFAKAKRNAPLALKPSEC